MVPLYIYHGVRNDGVPVVSRDGILFSPKRSQKVRLHSPDGFEWGYGGSGPAQLALALLLDVLQLDYAVALYQPFKFDYVGSWAKEGWEISTPEIFNWVSFQVNEARNACVLSRD